ncbi:inorganic phosphate transporter 1-4 /Pi cotransporter [Periconia macrospinosa]|uniref:Inorganic phosphate transporter 1-4 /Pi cotransporter n=1 Tax=Periconia macrospinosa TaxID=97972 RepID=A0A2V1DCP7_9PLEO|nr:inorganic phosphate transporter 1-4 /Pi cotransporter [Periconia macrospinosa]
MGVRKWLSRPMRGRRLGVEDLIIGDESVPATKRREWALVTIDDAPFQVWVVVVAGIGFLTDSFGLFCLNVVTPMIGYVYWHRQHDPDGKVPSLPPGIKTAMMCSTLAGTMIGQIVFGFAADFLGRRKMYGLELVIIIVGTMLMLMSSNGEHNSMAIEGWLIAWRAVMGLGIGADYPLSAVITAEFAPKKHRARMLSWVFFAQPVGQLLANILSWAALEAFEPSITDKSLACTDDDCLRAIDRLWRLVIGLGMIPALIALAFRFTIPESPRYKLDVLRNVQNVFEDTQDYFGGLDTTPEELDALPTTTQAPSSPAPQGPSRRSSLSSEIALDEMVVAGSDSDSEHRRPSSIYSRQTPRAVEVPPGDPNYIPPLASIADAKNFFINEGNWHYLLGTSLSWFFLDFAFYGLGLSSPDIVRHIMRDTPDRTNVLTTLRGNSTNPLQLVSIGALIGGALMIFVIRYVSPKKIQFWGFLVLFVLLLVMSATWKVLLVTHHGRKVLKALYVLIQIAFNLGPNVTTFIIPAEIFPTRYRCTCHGIAAASGKLSSWLVQLFIAFVFTYPKDIQDPIRQFNFERDNFGKVLGAMSAFMVAGAVVTWYFVPETRERGVESRSLEVLACGKQLLDQINKEGDAEKK